MEPLTGADRLPLPSTVSSLVETRRRGVCEPGRLEVLRGRRALQLFSSGHTLSPRRSAALQHSSLAWLLSPESENVRGS